MRENQSLPELHHGWKRVAALLFLGFSALVLCRFVASYWLDDPKALVEGLAPRGPGSLNFLASNYRKDYTNNAASFELQAANVVPAGQLSALEVYTREAKLGATTGRFDDAVRAALEAIDSHGAEIRLESNEGVAPHRSFRVVIRAPVSRFDLCVEDLHRIGEVQTYSVTKEDKSEEVRQRFAERDALRAHADSLGKLREAKGEVADLIQLEGKIQKVEEQIQKLNVSLGDFVRKDSFNNVNYSLQEAVLLDIDRRAFPVEARLAMAIAWSIKWTFYAGCLVVFGWLIRWSLRQLS